MKISETLDAWFDGRKVKTVKTPPPAVIYEIWHILNDLKRYGVSKTISREARDVMKAHGYTTVEKGIGWEILDLLKEE